MTYALQPPPARTGLPRVVAALAVFAAWVAVTVLAPRLWSAVSPRSISDTISSAINPGIAAAVVLLLVCVAAFRWSDVGLTAPRPHTLRLLWFPSLYVVAFLALATFVGFPAPAVIAIILINTLLAGISEELACRGILYQGLRARLSIWPAMLLSTVLFGAVHVLNGLSTGQFLVAGVQAIAAFMTGMSFMAIRVRTGSLYPGIVLHGIWDFLLLVSVTGLIQRFGVPEEPATLSAAAMLLLPLALVVPNFLYGLFLLRHAARDEAE